VRQTPVNRVIQPAPNDWAKLPAMRHPPVKVTDDARRIRPELVKAAPAREPFAVSPPRQIARHPHDASRVDAARHAAEPKDRPAGRDPRSEALSRPPLNRTAPPEERAVPPVQRAPRSQAPRQSAPDGNFVAHPRPPKTQQTAPSMAAPGQVAAPPPQIAPRRPLRQELPSQPATVPFAGARTPVQPAIPRATPSAPLSPAAPRVAPTAPVPTHPAVPRAAPTARQEPPLHRFISSPRVQTAAFGARAKAQ
jgi:hypothetical protein